MKLVIFAAALAISSAGMAQQTSAPGNTAPERDARGIPVVSDAAVAPAGANAGVPAGTGQVVPAPNQAAAFATQASSKTYPACSKTVTDGCVQTYERGRK